MRKEKGQNVEEVGVGEGRNGKEDIWEYAEETAG